MESDRLFYEGREQFIGARLTKADEPEVVSYLLYEKKDGEATNFKVVKKDVLEGLFDM